MATGIAAGCGATSTGAATVTEAGSAEAPTASSAPVEPSPVSASVPDTEAAVERPDATGASGREAAASTPSATPAGGTPVESGDVERGVAAPNGRVAPRVARTPGGLADQIARAVAGLGDPAATADELADWGHLHQIAIRKFGYRPDWDTVVFESLPAELRASTLLHVSARRALVDLHSGYDTADFVPAWAIVEPERPDDLLAYYRSAEDATGIEWEYLAAINLIETGMGRIRGLSSAGAQGPMQFLPTTWTEAGIGAGDINDPNDAIQAAARYLVRRGGPADMDGAIWGYNNSDDYVTAVKAYAELLRRDPAAFTTIYHWEIYFSTDAGDIWLPTGFRADEQVDLDAFLEQNPWSAPDPGLRGDQRDG